MTGALDYYGFAVLFPEVPTHYSSVKVLSFIQVAFMGDRRGFFNCLHLSFSSSNLPVASQEFAPGK